jgi:MarR family transcriptional regulator, repressor for mepA
VDSPGGCRTARRLAQRRAVEVGAGLDTAMAAADEMILAPLDQAERPTLQALVTKMTAELPQPTRS